MTAPIGQLQQRPRLVFYLSICREYALRTTMRMFDSSVCGAGIYTGICHACGKKAVRAAQIMIPLLDIFAVGGLCLGISHLQLRASWRCFRGTRWGWKQRRYLRSSPRRHGI